MPRTTHPLTPASSTDLKGQDGSKQIASLQMSFELPPPALSSQAKASPPDSEPSPRQGQPKTLYPLQASETVKSRRRSSTLQSNAAPTATAKDSFALPPPPTRSRKIIQMKPRTQGEAEAQSSIKDGGGGGKSGAAAPAAGGSGAAPGGNPTGAGTSAPATKKKQPSATSAAGRKMARKTAHSLIERRRRSKMNEEFATLKNMIPACTGEMHKLAILQASIEYVRYLEDCVSKLKAQREGASAPMELAPPPMTTYDDGNEEQHNRLGPGSEYDACMADSPDDDDGDVEMHGGAGLPSPIFTANPTQRSSTHSSSVSPALLGADSRRRDDSYSSVSTAAAITSTPVLGPDGRRYSLASATTPSPAFEPQTYTPGLPYSSRPGSTLTSPALQPLRDVDHEATAALLMLNSDRRGTANTTVGASGGGGGGSGAGAASTGRGMSVRDLLST